MITLQGTQGALLKKYDDFDRWIGGIAKLLKIARDGSEKYHLYLEENPTLMVDFTRVFKTEHSAI